MARYLHEQGYRNRKGKPLGTKLLCDALKREIYSDGFYRWNGIVSEKTVLEPIIDRPTWEQANRVVMSNRTSGSGAKRGSRRDDSPYVLQGVLKCRHCGGNLIGRQQKLGIRYYVCSTYMSKTKAACQGSWIKAEPVEAQALNILRAAVSNRYVLGLTRQEMSKMSAERNPELLSAIRLSERHMRELEDNHRKLLSLFYKNAINEDQFKMENDRIVKEEAQIKEGLDHLKKKLEILRTQNLNLDKIFSILDNFEAVYGGLQPKARKHLFNTVFRFAHAKSLGRWKPKYLDDYELKEPFDQLLTVGDEGIDKNALKNKWENLSIRSSPMGVR